MLIPALFVASGVKQHATAHSHSFDVVIVADASEVSDDHRQWMEQNGIILCDSLDSSRFRNIAVIQDRLSVMTLIKLALADHFNGRYEKILYLDTDLSIHDDVSAIFSLDTGEFPLAAAPVGRIWVDQKEELRKSTEEHMRALGMTRPFRFFNSGVLYIDTEKWTRMEIGPRTLDFIRRNRDLCTLPDEHGLNGLLNGRFAQISPIWNMRPDRPFHRKIARDIANPVIVHYAGPHKPWRRFGYQRRLFPDLTAYRLYRSFLARTPWQGWLNEQWNAHDLFDNITWEVRLITRALRGRREGPSSQQRLGYVDAFQRLCMEERFSDVEQGIAIRDNNRLRLKPSQGTRP